MLHDIKVLNNTAALSCFSMDLGKFVEVVLYLPNPNSKSLGYKYHLKIQTSIKFCFVLFVLKKSLFFL